MSDREAVQRRIDELSPMGVRFVARLVDSLASPPRTQIAAPQSTWINAEDDWIEYFGLVISAHHGTTAEPLGLLSFETAFCSACEAVGWIVDRSGSATQRFIDITVRAANGPARKLSLKSTAARNLSKSSVHISKLTEAAWIQDVRSARDRRKRTQELFGEYRKAVDAIVMLRAFRSDSNSIPNRYQLIEIPSAIFASIAKAPVSAFNADGPTVDCAYGDHEVAARVSLDRSDAKITVKQVLLAACDVHAEWELT